MTKRILTNNIYYKILNGRKFIYQNGLVKEIPSRNKNFMYDQKKKTKKSINCIWNIANNLLTSELSFMYMPPKYIFDGKIIQNEQPENVRYWKIGNTQAINIEESKCFEILYNPIKTNRLDYMPCFLIHNPLPFSPVQLKLELEEEEFEKRVILPQFVSTL
jgi:hypothetical protein